MAHILLDKLSLAFGAKRVLHDISLEIPDRGVVALIGPSGCGKSTLLRCINRMHDLNPEATVTGDVLLDGQSVHDQAVDVHELRQRVGMVFQKPNPFPKSVFENIAYGLRVRGVRKKQLLRQRVEESLAASYLWEEVRDLLHHPALALSGGQQQRLCIARCIATAPDVLLMDEPTSALDPMATEKIEELILQLRQKYTILIVTHNMQQARRVSDHVAMLYLGQLVEFAETTDFFAHPRHELAQRYVSGIFG
jgi:phosphate transport system ATP-binding protein